MADKIAKRGISIYIDGQQVTNSVRSIQAEMRKLSNEQALMTVGSDEYVRHARKIAQLNAIFQEHKDYQAEITKQYSKMGDAADDFEVKKKKAFSMDFVVAGVNKLKGAITGFLASIVLDKAVSEFALLDDAQANVRKYTGMTVEEVKDLNNEIKKIDTRTARIALNDFASDAGRLGIQGKKGTLEFAEGANILNVALGEDLGEGAVKSIGKLAQMFGDADRLGLKQAMLSTGSAINEVAQNSSAAEPYLVDFSNRLSGVGVQAGYSIAQIIGLGSVLDQNAQQVEMSATALSGLIMKLYQEPAKFAKIAGLDVKDFSQLLRKDANEALLTLLDTLGKKGGLSDLAPIFNEMKLDGARAASVLSVLAGNISSIRKEQETATQAFKEGTSVIDEYDVQNNTFSANLDKSKKVLQDYIYELGERLAPHVLDAAKAGGSLISILSILTNFLFNNGKAILTVVGAIIAYNVAVKAQNAYMIISNTISSLSLLRRQAEIVAVYKHTAAQAMYNKAIQNGNLFTKVYLATTALFSAAKYTLTGNITKARVALQLFTTVVRANPLGAVVTVVLALGYALYQLYKYVYDGNDAFSKSKALLESVKEETKKYTEEIVKEQSAFSTLMRALINTNEKSEIRKELIKDLKTQYPQFLKYINLEVLSNRELEAVLKGVNDQYEKRYEIAALQGRTDAEGKLITEMKDQQITIKEQLNALYSQTYTSAKDEKQIKDLEKQYDSLASKIGGSINKLSGYNQEISKIQSNINKENTIDGLMEMIDEANNQIASKQEFLPGLNPKSRARLEKEIKDLADSVAVYWRKVGAMGTELADNPVKADVVSIPSVGKTDKSSVQRKKLQDALKVLEEDHLKAMSAIKENYLKDDQKTEFEHNQELLKQQDIYDDNRKLKLESLKKELTDPSIRIDIAKQIADIESKNLDRQIQQANKIKKILLDADPIEQEKQSHENRLRELGLFNDDVTKRTEAQKTAVELLEKQHADNLRKLSRKDANLQLKQLDTLQADAERVLSERKVKEKMSEHQFNDERLKIEADFLKRKLQINGLSLEKAEEIQKQITNNDSAQTINKADSRQSILNQYGLQNVKDKKEAELAILQYYEDQGLLSHEEALKARALIDQEYLQTFVDKFSQVNEIVSQIGGNLTGTMSNFQSAEESAVSRKYDKQITAAEGNSKRQKKLEEQKQKDLNAIRAKYADKQFLVTVAQTISSTALAAMESYKAMAGIPVVGPALGVAAAAAAVAFGGSQIAVAKEQRDAAKEGYFDGGYTGGTNPKEVRGYFPDGSPYHGKEFVANHKSTANGLLKPLFDVVDDAQRNNTVSSLTKRDLAKALRISGPGYISGGYTGNISSPSVARDTRYEESYDRFVNVMERLEARLDVPLKAGVTITGDDGIEHQLNLYNKMKSDASR